MVPVGLAVLIFLISGILTGVAGFGFAVLSTMALTVILEPSIAIALVLPAFIGVNASLVADLDKKQIKSCSKRFYPYVLSILVTSIVGMIVIESVPESPLRIFLGILTFAFVVSQTDVVKDNLGSNIKDGCFVESTRWMVIVGSISGLLFGATNIGVQVVAYLKSCDLSQRVFAGVLGLTFLGVNIIRFGIAVSIGMYPMVETVVLSILLSIPAVIGVSIGKKAKDLVSDRSINVTIYLLLIIIALRLLTAGLEISLI